MPEFEQEIRKRLEGLGLSPAREAEIVEELSQHLDDQYEQELSHGATEDAAREAVLTELNQSDILATSLKRVERRVPQNPIQLGTAKKTNMISDLNQDVRRSEEHTSELQSHSFISHAVFWL